MKRYFLILMAGLLAFSAFGCAKEGKGGEILRKEEQSSEVSNQEEETSGISNKVIKQSRYDTIAEYAQYLEDATGDVKKIEFFLDEYSDEEHVVTIENHTDRFFYADFDLDSTDENSGFLILARPNRNEYYYRHFDDVPDTYVINDYAFYKFTYPDAGFYYEIEDDGDSEGYVWENVVVAPENNNLEDLTKLAKRIYAECVLTDLWYEFYYVFTDEVEKVEYNEYYYYDLADAEFGFKVDLEAKQISFFERIDGEWEDSVVIDMD